MAVGVVACNLHPNERELIVQVSGQAKKIKKYLGPKQYVLYYRLGPCHVLVPLVLPPPVQWELLVAVTLQVYGGCMEVSTQKYIPKYKVRKKKI